MATDLEKALQAGGQIPEKTDLELSIDAGGKPEVRGMTPFMNRAISGIIGGPADIVASGMSMIPGVNIDDPFLGRKSVERGFEAVGVKFPSEEAVPRTPAEYIGSTIGETTGLMVPAGTAMKILSRGKGLTGKITQTIWDSMVKYPKMTISGEIAGAAGAGGGRYLGEEVYPEQPLVRPLAELVGGVAAGIVPTIAVHTPSALAYRATKGYIKKGILPFGEKGSLYRAGKFIKKQVVSPGKAAERLEVKTVGELPPVVALKEKKLNALYSKLREMNPVTDNEAIENISRSFNRLEKEIRNMGYGSSQALKELTDKRLYSLKMKMENRILKAMETAQNKLEAIPVATRKSHESIITRNELDKVLKSEWEGVKGKWLAVRKEIKVDYSDSRILYQQLLKDTPKAQLEDIPTVLKQSFLGYKEKIPKIKTAYQQTLKVAPSPPTTRARQETIKEMQGLRSKLIEISRQARSNKEWNKARIADDVADSLLDDMGAGVTPTPDGENLRVAISATKNFKERFEQGIVGKILGRQKTGAPSISPELTLDISIGREGLKGAVDLDKVAVTPEAITATKRYLARSFTDYADPNKTGQLNPLKSQKWIRANEEILDKMPELKNTLNDASSAQELANNTRQLMDARLARIRDPKISISERYLNIDLGQEVDKILKSSDPMRMTIQMVKQARKDTTGKAVEGLRSSFIDYLIDKSAIGAYNEAGEQTLSGNALISLVNKQRNVLKQIMPDDQIERILRIGRELATIEVAERVRPLAGEIKLDDMPSNLLVLIARFAGARVGSLVGGGTVQVPGMFSQQFKTFTQRLNKDRALQLVHDAITSPDPTLLKSLLLPLDKPGLPSRENLLISARAVNLWLAGTGARVMEDVLSEAEEDQPLGSGTAPVLSPSQLSLERQPMPTTIQGLRGQSTL